MKINIKKAMLTLLAVPMLAAGVAGLVAPHVGAAAASDNGLGLRKGVGSAKGNDQVSCLFRQRDPLHRWCGRRYHDRDWWCTLHRLKW